MALGDIGKAEIEVVADTSRFPESAKRGVEQSLHDADPSFKKAGEDWGDVTSKNFGQRIKSRVPEIIRDFGSELRRQHIREDLNIDVNTNVNKDNVRNFVRKIADSIENEVSSSSSGGGGGPFGKIGQTIFDAIGSAFNVSGKSPLIYLLIPAVGAIAALITAAIEAVYGLGAALLTIPNILAAIGLQAGVLYLIFRNISGTIAQAFAAQNIYELAAAFKGVDPYIQNFILELIYIRDAFKSVSSYLSINFFKELGNTLLDIFDYNRYTLFKGLFDLAGNLGKWFSEVGKAFQTNSFALFLSDLFKQINTFLARNGPTLSKFLTQVFMFLDSLMGATGDVGGLLNDWLKSFGDFLEETSKSKDFQEWLKEMPGILRDSGALIKSLLDLVVSLFSATNRGGGQDFIQQLIKLVDLLTWFFSTQNGAEALRSLMGLVLLLTAAFVGLVFAIGSVISTIQILFNWIFGTAIPAIGDFFKKLWNAITDGLSPKPIVEAIENLIGPFLRLPARLYNIGVEMIKSFIRGIRGSAPAAAATAAARVVEAVAGAFPSSPAKYGPFSGKGAPYARGVSTVEDFTKGLRAASDQAAQSAASSMSNVNFGTGAVVANFYGSQPSPDQARRLGAAVGNGIGDQLLARNARLAVRTM